MTQVKDMKDQELNRKLAELMGYKIGRKVDYGFKPEYDCDVIALPDDRYMFIPNYCNDPAAAEKVQAKALDKDAEAYIHHLDFRVIPYGCRAKWVCDEVKALLNANPRQRSEAAYITLSSK